MGELVEHGRDSISVLDTIIGYGEVRRAHMHRCAEVKVDRQKQFTGSNE
jgi:hypothetical protein